MSKIVRSLDDFDRAMNMGLSQRELAHMEAKHRKWPLGTPVMANTSIGRIQGRVLKHWRSTEYRHSCSVEFPTPMDLGDSNGKRLGHVIPFRNLKKVSQA